VLNAAVAVSDEFLDDGVIVSQRGRIADSNHVYEATHGDILEGKPLVVMVNGGPASASEVVAGALQDHKRALLVGSRTFGKGLVQTVLPLRDGDAIVLTTARYYTPNGRNIQTQGIAPDIELAPLKLAKSDAEKLTIREADLKGRLERETSGDPELTGTAPVQEDAELAQHDYTLYESLNALKGLIAYRPIS